MSIDYQNFKNTLIYTATASSGRIFEELNEIAKLHKYTQEKKGRANTFFFIGFFGVIVSFFIWSAVPLVGLILLVVFLITVIVSGILMAKYGRLDVPNYRYELSNKVLSMLNRDIKESTDVNINLILSPPIQKNKRVSTGSHPHRRGWKVELFQDEWLTIEGEFLDGNRFQLKLTEIHQIASGSNRRGKYKSKKKSKGGAIYLKLNCNQRQYGAMKILRQNARGAIKLPETASMRKVTITDKAILLTVKVSSNVSNNQEALYETITMMFLSSYQILNLAKMLTKTKNN